MVSYFLQLLHLLWSKPLFAAQGIKKMLASRKMASGTWSPHMSTDSAFSTGVVEWLLEYAERWMYPSDFKVRGTEDSEEEISVAEQHWEARLQV